MEERGEGGVEMIDQVVKNAINEYGKEDTDQSRLLPLAYAGDQLQKQQIVNYEEGSEKGKGEEAEEEEGEDGEGEGDGYGDGEEEEDGDEKEGQPIDEDNRSGQTDGFFELEVIRRKRVKKGVPQYLVKWRGWPESANTWEPLENLEMCLDVVDSFEESLQSRKNKGKRKRKYVEPRPEPKNEPKKKQSRSYPVHSLQSVDNPTSTQCTGSDQGGEKNNGDLYNVRIDNRIDENGASRGSKKIGAVTDEIEHDPKISELRGTISNNEVNANNPTISLPEGKAYECAGPSNGSPIINNLEGVHSRRTGAKRRKSGSVKRFTQEPTPYQPVLSQDITPNVIIGPVDPAGWLETGHPCVLENNIRQKLKTGNSTITKIIRPISFSASALENDQDISVSFIALRSDGIEVEVSNKYLKAVDPLLLIDYYERHLKFSPLGSEI